MLHQYQQPRMSSRDPLSFLAGVHVDLDPQLDRITLNSGLIEVFGGFTQGTAANRATWNPGDTRFGGRPYAVFDGSNDLYALGALNGLGWTSAECFVIFANDADPAAATATSGLYRIGSINNACHVPWTDGVIYESFGTNAQRNTGNPTANLAAPVLYNVWNANNDFAVRINRATHFTSAAFGAAAFSAGAQFGNDTTPYFKGRLARFILCNQKQSTAARERMQQFCRDFYNV